MIRESESSDQDMGHAMMKCIQNNYNDCIFASMFLIVNESCFRFFVISCTDIHGIYIYKYIYIEKEYL